MLNPLDIRQSACSWDKAVPGTLRQCQRRPNTPGREHPEEAVSPSSNTVYQVRRCAGFERTLGLYLLNIEAAIADVLMAKYTEAELRRIPVCGSVRV